MVTSNTHPVTPAPVHFRTSVAAPTTAVKLPPARLNLTGVATVGDALLLLPEANWYVAHRAVSVSSPLQQTGGPGEEVGGGDADAEAVGLAEIDDGEAADGPDGLETPLGDPEALLTDGGETDVMDGLTETALADGADTLDADTEDGEIDETDGADGREEDGALAMLAETDDGLPKLAEDGLGRPLEGLRTLLDDEDGERGDEAADALERPLEAAERELNELCPTQHASDNAYSGNPW